MSDKSGLSDVKRALLEKYLREKHAQAATAARIGGRSTQAEGATLPEGIEALQPHGPKQPFFFLHGQWHGDAFYCFPLSHGLGSGQPFYTLEPYRFDGLQVPSAFETIASRHLELLDAVQSEGPYLLGGWCNGALVAYEMARQLHTRGKEVDLLVLMDPVNLVYPARVRVVRSLIKRFGHLMKLGQEKQLEVFLRIRHFYRYLERFYADVRLVAGRSKGSLPSERKGRDAMGNLLPELHSILPTREVLQQDYPGIFDWVAMGYKPDSYPGKITILWSQQAPFRSGWRKVLEANDVDIHHIPGTHITCRTQFLPVLIEHLKACLDKAQATVLS